VSEATSKEKEEEEEQEEEEEEEEDEDEDEDEDVESYHSDSSSDVAKKKQKKPSGTDDDVGIASVFQPARHVHELLDLYNCEQIVKDPLMGVKLMRYLGNTTDVKAWAETMAGKYVV